MTMTNTLDSGRFTGKNVKDMILIQKGIDVTLRDTVQDIKPSNITFLCKTCFYIVIVQGSIETCIRI